MASRSATISLKNGRKSSVTQTTTFPWLSWACKQPTVSPKALEDRNQTRAVGDHEFHSDTELPEWRQPFTEGSTRRSSSSTDVSPADLDTPPPASSLSAHLPARRTSNKAGGMHDLFTHFPKDPNCDVCRRAKVTTVPCRRNLDDRADRIKRQKCLAIWKQQTTRLSTKIKRRDCITNLQWSFRTWRLNGFQVIYTKSNQLRRRREVSDNSYVQKKIQDTFIRNILWIFQSLRITDLEIMGGLHRIDPQAMELQSELHDEREKTLRQWFSLDFMLSSKRTSRWSDNFWTSVQFTIWRADYSVWSRSKILSDIINRPRLSGSVRHKSPSWKCSWDTAWTRREVGLVIYR